MSGNVTIPATGTGTATPVIATDDIGGVHYQLIKLAFGALNTGTLVESSAGLPVAVVAALPAGSNLIGDVGIQPRAANGLSTMNATSSDGATALTNSAQAIKASAGLLYGYHIYNPNAAAAFVQFYNTASGSVTVGTTNPLFMLTVPPLSAVSVMNSLGITFSNAGFSWAATSAAGTNGALSTALDAVAWYA